MRLNSEAPLAVELSDNEIRQHTIEAQINIGIPFQLRGMREHREWTQETLAKKLGMTQNMISRLENPKTSKPTIKTLIRIARAFDVGLLVRFAPFGFYSDVIEAMNSTHVEIPSYDEEFAEQERKESTVAAIARTGMPRLEMGTIRALGGAAIEIAELGSAATPVGNRAPEERASKIVFIDEPRCKRPASASEILSSYATFDVQQARLR